MHYFLTFLFGIKLYMFRTVPLSIIRSFSLYTQQWYIYIYIYMCVCVCVCVVQVTVTACEQDQDGTTVPSWSCSQASSKPVWHIYIPLLCVQCKTPDDGLRDCLEHVEFYSKNKFEKLMHLVGCIIRTHTHIYMYICVLFVRCSIALHDSEHHNNALQNIRTWWPVHCMLLYQTSSNMYPFTISNDTLPPTHTDYA